MIQGLIGALVILHVLRESLRESLCRLPDERLLPTPLRDPFERPRQGIEGDSSKGLRGLWGSGHITATHKQVILNLRWAGSMSILRVGGLTEAQPSMTPAQQIYLRECYTDYQKASSRCRHCSSSDKEFKRWEDAVYSVASYIDGIAKPHGYPLTVVSRGVVGDILKCGDAVVMEGDNYDGGPRAWYWRFNFMDAPNWSKTPVDALISFVNALEEKLGADSAAPSLVFIVRISSRTCTKDDHDWEFLYEGRHGSDKGDMVYECRVCKMEKRE